MSRFDRMYDKQKKGIQSCTHTGPGCDMLETIPCTCFKNYTTAFINTNQIQACQY